MGPCWRECPGSNGLQWARNPVILPSARVWCLPGEAWGGEENIMAGEALKILLIEHEPAFERYLRDMLDQARDLSVDLQLAGELQAGLQALAGASFDAVILDLCVPDGAGLGNVGLIRAVAPGLPIIVTGEVDDEILAVETVHEGAQDYLVKNQLTPSAEMVLTMEQLGLQIEKQHHEVATAGQAEIDIRFDTLVKMADNMMVYKYVLKNVAKKHGKTVTLMPKPLFGDNGSGMHTHQSLWKKGKPLFAGKEYGGLSKMALYYIGGLLKHAHALCAFCSPTTNSYKRLVPGFEAPVNLAYSARNRSAAVRIPTYSDNPKTKRIEYRPPDPAANPYIAFAALLLAGLDGVQNKIDPGEPIDKNMYELPPEEHAKIPQILGSLDAAIDALEKDHQFLLKGDVFTEDFIEMWISTKRKEHDAIRLRPHPYEFFMYYDV